MSRRRLAGVSEVSRRCLGGVSEASCLVQVEGDEPRVARRRADGVQAVVVEHDCALAGGKLGGDGVLEVRAVGEVVLVATDGAWRREPGGGGAVERPLLWSSCRERRSGAVRQKGSWRAGRRPYHERSPRAPAAAAPHVDWLSLSLSRAPAGSTAARSCAARRVRSARSCGGPGRASGGERGRVPWRKKAACERGSSLGSGSVG